MKINCIQTKTGGLMANIENGMDKLNDFNGQCNPFFVTGKLKTHKESSGKKVRERDRDTRPGTAGASLLWHKQWLLLNSNMTVCTDSTLSVVHSYQSQYIRVFSILWHTSSSSFTIYLFNFSCFAVILLWFSRVVSKWKLKSLVLLSWEIHRRMEMYNRIGSWSMFINKFELE